MKNIITTIVILGGYVSFFGTLAQGAANGLTLAGLAMIVGGYAVREHRQAMGHGSRRQKDY